MVASANYEQYTPFPRAILLDTEGFQSSEEESELHSPVFEHTLATFLPMECAYIRRSIHSSAHLSTHKARYQPKAPDCLLPHDSLIAPPYTSQCYVQSQGLGAHHHGYPKEPPNTALGYNASVQSHSQSFTSSAYELVMPHCFPLLMNSALNKSVASVDVPSSSSQINPSHFHLSHPPTTSAPVPQPPLTTPTDTLDPSTSAIAHPNADTSVASSSRAGPSRNTSSGVIACRQWCVNLSTLLAENALLPSVSVTDGLFSRSRKIRCDSTRPNCQNCIKRGNECVYDKVPKRRGPDKRPGTRKRSCKKRQSDGSDPQPKKKRRTDPVDQGTTAHPSYGQYEISSVAIPMFGPAHHKANKVDIEPPTTSSSLTDPTTSFHDAYYVKVSSSLASPVLFEHFFSLHGPTRFTPEAAITDINASAVDIT